MTYPYLIAEAGVAHFGDYDKALQLLHAAIKAKCDCFKLQTFDPRILFANDLNGWRSRLEDRVLTQDKLFLLHSECQSNNIDFLLTLHDESHFEVIKKLSLRTIKIGSGEAGNISFIRECLNYCDHLIYSTGLSTVAQINEVYEAAIKLRKRITIMHCNTAYPTPMEDVNLLRIRTLMELFPMASIGYSDHTITHDACIGAIFLGATVIERHITLDKDIPNAQDWKVSSMPDELISLRTEIDRSYDLLGSPDIHLTQSSQSNSSWALKSPYLRHNVPAGSLISHNDIIMKRPHTGFSIDDLQPLLNIYKTSTHLPVNHPLTPSDFV